MKDRLFSKDDFQIINMNYKLKKIKNRKKRSQYKKNDLFETLDNTTNPQQVPGKTSADSHSDNSDAAAFFPSFFPSFSNISSENENVVEPFYLPELSFPPYSDENYDGIDNVDDRGAAIDFQYDPREWLIALIEWIYYYLNSFNHYWSAKMVNILSKNTGQESDIKLVRNYIAWTEAIAAGCYVVYNWFFIIVYPKYALENKINFLTFNFEEQYEQAKKNKIKNNGTMEQIWYAFLVIIHYFFDYPFVILYFLNKFVVETFPGMINGIFPPSFLFVYLFYQSCLFLKNSAIVVKHLFINSLLFKVDAAAGLIYGIIVILWLKDVVLLLKKIIMGESSSGEGADPQPKPPLVILGLVLFNLLERIIKLIFLIMIGIPATVLAVVFYFLLYSFFGIFFYKGFKFDTFTKIDILVNGEIHPYVPDICDGYHWYDFLYEIFNIVMIFFHTIQGKLFTISFILLYAYSCLDYAENITPNTYNLKNGLLAIDIGLIITLFSMVMSYFLEKMQSLSSEKE
jgi:hypothetical protein